MKYSSLIEKLLKSKEPSIQWKIKVNVLGMDRELAEIKNLEKQIKNSARVQALLQRVDDTGSLRGERSVYDKWQGTHWVLMSLADIGYPQGAKQLFPLADAVFKMWLGKRFFNEFIAMKKTDAYQVDAIPVMQGRHRTCASQQGNALYAILTLGLEDDRIHQLAERLMYWQWPDGGWNCDKNPDARKSTFIHTLYSMRALALYSKHTGNKEALKSAQKASEIFLKRKLFKRASNQEVIHPEFIKLHYPLYWHYDILGALKIFAEIDITKDKRLHDALDLLEKKELPTGGWAAEGRYYKKISNEFSLNADYVEWGGTSTKQMNEWVTADTLFVLKHFDRLT
jgi:hypothetical protein